MMVRLPDITKLDAEEQSSPPTSVNIKERAMMPNDESPLPTHNEPNDSFVTGAQLHRHVSSTDAPIPHLTSAEVLSHLQRLEELVRLLLIRSDGTAPGLMTVKEAAQFLKISERTIRAQLTSKQWPSYRCGAAVRVDPLEIKARMKRVPFCTKRSRTSRSSG